MVKLLLPRCVTPLTATCRIAATSVRSMNTQARFHQALLMARQSGAMKIIESVFKRDVGGTANGPEGSPQGRSLLRWSSVDQEPAVKISSVVTVPGSVWTSAMMRIGSPTRSSNSIR